MRAKCAHHVWRKPVHGMAYYVPVPGVM